MRKLQKVATMLLVFCLIMSCVSCNVGIKRKPNGNVSLDNFEFTELLDGTYSIKASLDNNLSGTVILPSTYNDKSITKIAFEGFENCNITKICIPNGYTLIGGYAFYNCKNLKTIEWADSLTEIGQGAFAGCSNLINTIVLPKNLEKIGDLAFSLCSNLLVVDIPKTVSSIGENVFKDSDKVVINIDYQNPNYKVVDNQIVQK